MASAILKLPVFLALWALMLLLKGAVTLFGLVLVPIMLRLDGRPAWLWRPWLNPEEGTEVPSWWAMRTMDWPSWWSHYWFHAIRNPANGLRTFEWLDADIEPKRIRWIGTDVADINDTSRTIASLTWQGFQAGLVIIHPWNDERHLRVRVGWKLVPHDRYRAPEWRAEDAGFACSVIPWRHS